MLEAVSQLKISLERSNFLFVGAGNMVTQWDIPAMIYYGLQHYIPVFFALYYHLCDYLLGLGAVDNFCNSGDSLNWDRRA